MKELGIKKCTKCGSVKILEDFNLAKHHSDGRSSRCRSCHNRYAKKIREERRNMGVCVYCGGVITEKYLVCSKCRKYFKEKDVFYKKKWEKSGICTACGSRSNNIRTKFCDICLEKFNTRTRKKQFELSSRVGDYFSNKCAICNMGSKDYEVLECHHYEPSKKKYQIGNMKDKDWETVVVPELEKCVYLCRNCHARLHAHRFDEDIASGKLVLIPGKVEEVGVNGSRCPGPA